MMIAPGEVEDAIIRLAQKSRAVGIHLRAGHPAAERGHHHGMIKANVPARIAFAVSSQTDSRVILDQNGAEALLGEGDMLFRPASESRLARIKGAFITEAEIEQLTDHWRGQGEPEMQEELLEAVEPEELEDPASSIPTPTTSWPTPSRPWSRWAPRPRRCSSGACGSATRAPGG